MQWSRHLRSTFCGLLIAVKYWIQYLSSFNCNNFWYLINFNFHPLPVLAQKFYLDKLRAFIKCLITLIVLSSPCGVGFSISPLHFPRGYRKKLLRLVYCRWWASISFTLKLLEVASKRKCSFMCSAYLLWEYSEAGTLIKYKYYLLYLLTRSEGNSACKIYLILKC